MGLNIGQIPSALAANRVPPSAPQSRQAEAAAAETPRSVSRADFPPGRQDDALESFQENQRNPVRVGFGDGTVSPVVAALDALDRGLTRAREFVPTIPEVQETFRERTAERAAEIVEEFQDQRDPEPVFGVPEPSPQVRNFVGQVDEAAEPVRVEVSPEVPAGENSPARPNEIAQENPSRAQVELNTAPRPESSAFNPVDRPPSPGELQRIDVRV